tara:strand:- start:186 stop:530 length:345 start_codon:yes stop_codon:yes gene_type:complete
MDFNDISEEHLRKVLLIIDKQQQENTDLISELKESLDDSEFTYEEIDILMNTDVDDALATISYKWVLVYNLINALGFNNTLLTGFSPLFKDLKQSREEEYIKNKINKDLDLDVN